MVDSKLRLVLVWLGLGIVTMICTDSAAQNDTKPEKLRLSKPDQFTILAPINYISGAPASNDDGTVNAVIEIPAGSAAKWEVDKLDGALRWEFRDDKPRVIDYLPYPGNYGMIPRTWLPESQGGDGDPLDIIVLGSAIERGQIAKVRLIGVLRLSDGGETDDKLLAVPDSTAFAGVTDVSMLRHSHPGVLTIVATWFANYKGAGQIAVLGFGGQGEAKSLLRSARKAFDEMQANQQKDDAVSGEEAEPDTSQPNRVP